MIDPDIIDLSFYGTLFVLSLEPLLWWAIVLRDSGRARPRVTLPAVLSSVAITVAIAECAFISWTLVADFDLDVRLFWNPVARRFQGIALFVALLAHWWWRADAS